MSLSSYLDVSTENVVLMELAPDSHRKTAQIAPRGKRVAPLIWPMSFSAPRDWWFRQVKNINIRTATPFSSAIDPRGLRYQNIRNPCQASRRCDAHGACRITTLRNASGAPS